jgi:hypothetical protein
MKQSRESILFLDVACGQLAKELGKAIIKDAVFSACGSDDAPVPERRPRVVVVNDVPSAAAEIAAAAAAAAKETAHVGHRVVVLATRARNHNDDDDGGDHDETGTGEFCDMRETRDESNEMRETMGKSKKMK